MTTRASHAPALASVGLGIATGTEMALESAGVTLVKGASDECTFVETGSDVRRLGAAPSFAVRLWAVHDMRPGLAVRRKHRKRLASALRTVLPPPTAPNERWSIDYASDALVGGTRLRAFIVVDDFTRECLAIEVDTSLPGLRAVRVLERIAERRPLPKYLICDNGPEFTGAAFDSRSHRRGVRVHFIRPGKPVENAYAESFNGKFRNECLNENWFVSMDDARARIEAWRDDYNEVRPHSVLDT